MRNKQQPNLYTSNKLNIRVKKVEITWFKSRLASC